MTKQKILTLLKNLTNHSHLELTTRGNSAIKAALSILSKEKKLLIPEEGGWLTYKDLPKKLNLQVEEVKCDDAKINLTNLKQKLKSNNYSAFLYQNPGGYFAQQPLEEIYQLCKEYNCLTILDVSGSLGTKLCDGNFADIIIGSFGKWKLVEAHVGGLISTKEEILFNKLKPESLNDEESLNIILEKLNNLPNRITFLTEKRNKVLQDLKEQKIVHQEDLGFVVVVKFSTDQEKETLINYCNKNNLEWTECPRYIRLNKSAISIEIKRLQE